MTSLSRTIADWVGGLTYDDLPPDVVDRAKGLILHALASALLGYGHDDSRIALRIMREEETGGGGVARELVGGARLTRAGAAYVNSEMISAGGKWDTFRMLTHPSGAVVPVVLVAADTRRLSGRALITGLVAGYEVMERLAADFIPTVMSRGFHASPVFGIFGAATALAKLESLDADGIHAAIAQCANLASGNLEGARSGGRSLREGAAVRHALLAVALARHGTPAGETVLEGEAGFFHAYAGNNLGRLAYSFDGAVVAGLDRITRRLGADWLILETLYRIYSTPGYNIGHVEVTAQLCEEHDIDPDDIEGIECTVNWLETEYPSPAFPSRSRAPHVGSPHYYAAYGAVRRGFPLLKDVARGTGEPDPPAVLALMQRVTLIPSHRHPLFAPLVTVRLRDGRSYSRAGTGQEFMWDFEEEARRLEEIADSLPVPSSQFARLIDACRTLDTLESASSLIDLTVAPRP